MKSKYLELFKRLKEESGVRVHGDKLVIEELQREEVTTKAGIILQEGVRGEFKGNDIRMGIVLLAGEGYWEENEEGKTVKVELDNKEGDLVLINTFARVPFKKFGPMVDYKEDSICMITQSGVHMTIKNVEKFLSILQGE